MDIVFDKMQWHLVQCHWTELAWFVVDGVSLKMNEDQKEMRKEADSKGWGKHKGSIGQHFYSSLYGALSALQ